MVGGGNEVTRKKSFFVFFLFGDLDLILHCEKWVILFTVSG